MRPPQNLNQQALREGPEGAQGISCGSLLPSPRRRERTMEVFRWVKVMLLATVLIIGLRLFAKEAGNESFSYWTGIVAVILVIIGGILAIVGARMDQQVDKSSEPMLRVDIGPGKPPRRVGGIRHAGDPVELHIPARAALDEEDEDGSAPQ